MIRAGIVGLGWWGRNLVNSIPGDSDILRFTAGTTRTRAKAEEFAEEHGIELRDRYDDLLGDPDIDAVVVATPHTQHAEQVMAAAAAGKHVFVEKPFALDVGAAEAAAAALAARGRVLAVGFNRRFHPAMAELRRRLADGALGTILHIEAVEGVPMGLTFEAGSSDQWRADRAEWPAGGLTPVGVHLIDGMIDLFGPITRVHCRSVKRAVAADIDDTTSVLLDFAAGPTGYLATLVATRPDLRFKVFGTAATAEITDRSYNNLEIVPLEGAAERFAYDGFRMEHEGLRAELEAFAAAASGAEPAIPPDQLVHGVGVLAAMIRSAASGETEPVA